MNHKVIIISTFILFLCACKSLNTNLSIQEKKIPITFSNNNDSSTVAITNWRNYFNDSLLIELIDTAIANNLDFQIALQRIELAKSGMQFAKGQLFPFLSVNAAAGSTKYAKYTPDYLGNATTEIEPGKTIPNPLQDYQLGLQTSWEVDAFGMLRNKRKAAIANYLASIEGRNYIVSNLVAQVAISYYELLALDNELDIVHQTIEKQKEALNVIQMQKEAGRANELAVQQFQANLYNAEALGKESEQQIVEIENSINFVLGRFPQIIHRNKNALLMSTPFMIATGIPSQLLLNRPDIREAGFQVQASKFDLKAAKGSFFPNVNITAALGFQAFDSKYLFMAPASIGNSLFGGIIAPVLNRSALQAQFHTAKAIQLTAMYHYQKAILNGYKEVVNELSYLAYWQEINALKKKETIVLQQSVNTSIELYKSAKATYLEILLTQQNYLKTQIELIDAQKNLKMSEVNIYKALGGGWR